ncbi:unnamed protein product (macronuclear) [Paramecium tetraurelia]|uniref:Uncharacterized protein n=1 Tax=Paramecium tetraurelia TaxID=5888 RepID=A0ECP1_PARTE|nr:uncharacterized protein GSPATT00003927001 [Paramecium tetraurelia]CAK93058.1 unnamed protein product [Paramecium tetraurelia]|eukprot:XP_001460455.1 hypothetical protein (macronuclear) [Paramecium tetraurelia strain d4-2]
MPNCTKDIRINQNMQLYKYTKILWILSNKNYGSLFSTYNDFRLFGGADTFGANTIISRYVSLPPHHQIKVTFEFLKNFQNKSRLDIGIMNLSKSYNWTESNGLKWMWKQK